MRLIIIGNGFDLNEGLDTSYLSFKEHLKCCNPDLFESMSFYYHSIADEDNTSAEVANFDKSVLIISSNNASVSPKNEFLWGNLERNLANISFPFIRRYCGFGKFPIDADNVIGDLCSTFDHSLVTLRKELKNWIRGINTSTLFKRKFDSNNAFISFNYTDTLVNRYGVNKDSICYIHNSFEDEDLIFGCSLKELEEFNNFRFPHEIENELSKRLSLVLMNHFKVTDEITKNKLIPFLSDKAIEEIVVLGSSFSDVDLPYFEALHTFFKKALWHISYREDSEERIKLFAMKNGISYRLIESIDDYLKTITHNADV